MKDYSLLRKCLRIAEKQNVGKKFYLDKKNNIVIKETQHHRSSFNLNCAKVLIEEYHRLGLTQFEIIENEDKILYKSPIVNLLATPLSKGEVFFIEKNFSKYITKILNEKLNYNFILKDGYTLKIFALDVTPKNIFYYKNHYLLLDLEGFYFLVFKNNKNVGMEGIKEEYKNRVCYVDSPTDKDIKNKLSFN